MNLDVIVNAMWPAVAAYGVYVASQAAARLQRDTVPSEMQDRIAALESKHTEQAKLLARTTQIASRAALATGLREEQQ